MSAEATESAGEKISLHNNKYLDFLATPTNSLHSPDFPLLPSFIVLVLNFPLDDFFFPLWSRASQRICADGGANRVYQYLHDHFPIDSPEFSSFPLPSLIVGDFDSLRPEVREFFQGKSVNFLHDQDENTTDMEKALESIAKRLESAGYSSDPPEVIVTGAFGGRFDSEISNFFSLYRFSSRFHRIFLLSQGNLAEFLLPGSHRLILSPLFEIPQLSHCGVFPLTGPVGKISTNGLRWNLQQSQLSWEGRISTNNIIDHSEVFLQTDSAVLWTSEFRQKNEEEEINKR